MSSSRARSMVAALIAASALAIDHPAVDARDGSVDVVTRFVVLD